MTIKQHFVILLGLITSTFAIKVCTPLFVCFSSET